MCATPVKRKLAAILAADAVGYSKLMSTDEEGTLKVLSAHRAVIDGIIEFHEGRIINTAGDSVLAEFGSPVEAVRCAVEIQDALKTRNDSLPEAQRLQFRIGVNLGDVMEKGADLLGDGVNVAARLESIAEPGGICVSSSVYDQIAGKLDLGFINIGTQSLKNIQRPIQVYRVERGGLRGLAQAAPAASPGLRRGPMAWAVVGALASVLVVGVLGWSFNLLPGTRPPDQAMYATESERSRAQADEARRAQEEKRTAENRARAEAELVRARAEAEAARRKAAAELAAAVEARRAAEASARTAAPPKRPPLQSAEAAPRVPVPSQRLAARAASAAPPVDYNGQWAAEIKCRAFGARPAFASSIPLAVTENTFNVHQGEQGKPGSFALSGTPGPDGQLQLSGDGMAPGGGRRASGQPYKAAFDGRFAGEHYEGAGQLGAQECTLAISRAR
jgi:class 3 adenylate cyclase